MAAPEMKGKMRPRKWDRGKGRWEISASLDLLREPSLGGRGDNGKGIDRPVRLAFFEIALAPRHLVGDVGKAQHRFSPRSSKSVERRRFHLDRQQTLAPHRCDRLRGL